MPALSSLNVSKAAIFLILTPLAFAAPHQNGSILKRQASSTQENAGWNLARFVHNGPIPEPAKAEFVDLGNGRGFSRKVRKGTYIYPSNGGEGVDIYIVENGVDQNDKVKQMFDGRLSYLPDPKDLKFRGEGAENWHGTMVAGIAGSKKFGVAQKANIISVSRKTSTETIIANHNKRKSQRGFKGSVVNYSAGLKSQSTENAEYELDRYRQLIKAGIHVVMSAGNFNMDACYHYPSNMNQKIKEIIAVGATNQDDERLLLDPSAGSDYGKCVDIYAPGSRIPTIRGDGSETTGAETSAAAPHIAGLIALELSAGPSRTPMEMKQHILSIGFPDTVVEPDGTRKILAGNRPLMSGFKPSNENPNQQEKKVETEQPAVKQSSNPQSASSPGKFEKQKPITTVNDERIVTIHFSSNVNSDRAGVTDPANSKGELWTTLESLPETYHGKRVRDFKTQMEYIFCGEEMPSDTPAEIKRGCEEYRH
ncbi:serine protease [Orbilia ellipsospora]|uniref:Serine protease n=1 Tax=Orbilia ellipsospora TaxID=2528407 RepID=A0AAV9XL18_9PEZI